MKPTIKYVISDVHMGLSHDGLTEVIRSYKKKNKLFAETMASGGLVLFINSAQDKAKLFGEGGEVLAYLKMPGRRAINEEMINMIPGTFGGSVTYSQAARAAFKGFMALEKRSARVRPIEKMRLHEEAG